MTNDPGHVADAAQHGAARRRGAAVLAGALALLSAVPAPACRCAPRSLEDYFAQADLVMVARAGSTRTAGDALTVEWTPIEPVYKGDPATIGALMTHRSSASCGVPVGTGETFLLFAARDRPGSRTAWFDTCNGTRRFGPDVTVADFIDTPADRILTRLQGLRVGAAVTDPTRNPGGPRLPKPGHPGAELIGLLELPTVLGVDQPGDPAPPPHRAGPALDLRAAPDAGAARVATIGSSDDVVTREYAYERPGAVVLEQRSGWYRLALPGRRSGWLPVDLAGAYHPVSELIVNRLGYLTQHWDGWIWPEVGAGIPIDTKLTQDGSRHEYPVNVLGTQDLGGTLWLRVEVLRGDPCEGGEPGARFDGWVPAYSPEGGLTTWFYARGC